MIANTGQIKTHHWKHKHLTENCPGSREGPWHLEWKNTCIDTERIEYHQGNRRADVLHRADWAIEFQHSSISPQEITEREHDWGGKLIWVFDIQEAFDAYRINWNTPYTPQHGPWDFYWRTAQQSIAHYAKATTFLDPGKGRQLWYIQHFRQPGRPSGGRAWPVPKPTFIEAVVNGTNPPTWPDPNQFPQTDAWKGHTTERMNQIRGLLNNVNDEPGMKQAVETEKAKAPK